MKRILFFAAACAALLALPASATWTYVPNDGTFPGTAKSVNSNDKYYNGYITDSSTWSIYVYQFDGENWSIGCAKPGTGALDGGRYAKYGSALAGDELKTGTGKGSGALDLSTLATDLPDMNFTVVAARAFQSHSDMTSVKLPSTITAIGTGAFSTCTKLVTVDLSNTALVRIDDTSVNSGNEWSRGAFQNCTALEEVWLPETVEYIGSYAFTWLVNNKSVVHIPGPMPTFGDNAIGGHTGQYALCVNALQYKDWYNSYADWKYNVDSDMAGVNWPDPKSGNEGSGWIPERVRYSSNNDYPAPFGYASSGVASVISLARLYLIQEGEAGEIIPASSAVTAEVGRTNVTFTVTVDLGTSSSATLAFTFNGETKTENVTASGQSFTYEFPSGLTLETTYPYSSVVTASSGNGTTTGTITTIGPDVKLGATSCARLTDDGTSYTVSVAATLLDGCSGVLTLRNANGATVGTANVSASGTVSFTLTGLTIDVETTYSFRLVSDQHAEDVAEAALAFTPVPRRWVYTENENGATQYLNSQPYTGKLSNGDWTFYAYQPDKSVNEIWLGEGGNGSTAYETPGSPDLDLSGVYDDTRLRLVKIGGYAFWDKGASVLTSVAFPKQLSDIGLGAFYKATGLKDLDLSNTSVTNVGYMAFQNCTSLTNVVLPRTLQNVEGCAFAWGPSKRVIHFRGDVPTVGLTDFTKRDKNGTDKADQAFYSGNDNRQYAYCVDAKTFPRWTTDSTTTLYTDAKPFPESEEKAWIPEWVRYGDVPNYRKPFGNSKLGRGYDSSSNGRAYLIQESVGSGTMVLVY